MSQSESSMNIRKHIVVVGGGFAGLNFVRHLFDNKWYDVTLVDKNNYNYFPPLLYQVATSFLEPASISYPFRKLFVDKGISFILDTVIDVDAASNKLYLSEGDELSYDLLVFAAGTRTNFFGNESFIKNALPLKDIDDALYMRNEMINALEKAAVEKDPVEKQRLLRFVIAGGGPTGVELAGMIAEMRDHILREYPEMEDAVPEIYLIEAGENLLAPMSNKTHNQAFHVLSRLGVKVLLSRQVKLYEEGKVYLSDSSVIEARTLIWTSGVTANTFKGISKNSLGKGGRMLTDSYNRVIGYDNIYAIGDIALHYSDAAFPNGHPQVAQPAIQQGRLLARNMLAIANGRAITPFKYFDRGNMAIIGKRFAVADLFKNRLHVGGILGLLGWLFIHLMALVNYNNKIKTFYNWMVAYVTSDQALRMIFRSERRKQNVSSQYKTQRVDSNINI